jgi:hypothetical protein
MPAFFFLFVFHLVVVGVAGKILGRIKTLPVIRRRALTHYHITKLPVSINPQQQ